ncbi:MAG: hypothetical protein AB7O52_07555 [Planctomycetota bacterium]
MKLDAFDLSRGQRVGFGHGSLGNLLLRFDDVHGHGPVILKIYRRRGAWAAELFRSASHRVFEGRRACDPVARCDTERRSLALWQREGFDVPALIDLPIPPGLTAPALWCEYCPGRTLAETLMDATVAPLQQRTLLVRLGADLARRHRRALDRNEPLLVQEHGATTHVLVSEGRLVAFDLEGGFRPGFPVLEAITQELSSYLRSIARKAIHLPLETALAAFRGGYADLDLLEQLRRWTIESPSLIRHLKRWGDRRRERADLGKCALLDRLLDAEPDRAAHRAGP